MSETAPPEEKNTKRTILPIEVFIACDFENPIHHLKCTEAYLLASAYQKAVSAAKSSGRDNDAQAFGVLDAILSMHFRPNDRANVWGPMVEGAGWRSAIPSDFKGEQSEVFLALLAHVTHPVLKARLADIVWTNDRKQSAAATVAIDAYCECIKGRLSGLYTSEVDKDRRATFETCDFLRRGLQIANTISKKGALPQNIRDALKNLYDQARAEESFVVFRKTIEVGLYYELFDAAAIVADVEAVASGAKDVINPIAVKEIFDLGVRLYSKLADEEGKRRCQLGAVDQILAMRTQVSSAGAEAHWVMDALQALKHVKGVEDKEAELEQDLRRLQKASTREMVPLRIDVIDKENRDALIEAFEKYNLPDALHAFALLDRARPIEDLRKEALKTIETSPLMAMMPLAHVDAEGRTVAKTPGVDVRGEPDEEWFHATINKSESLRRVFTVANGIDPARQVISQKYTITEDALMPIVGCSPWIPQSQKVIMGLGFTRFLQGDFMSATYLLLPQIEPCLRHVMKINGHDPSKRYSNSTEEDLALGRLIERMRPELEKTLTPPILSEIELLFEKRPGPALRHEVAHGQIGAGGCFHPDVIYACWLLYRLSCLFAFPHWDSVIKPAILAVE